MIQQRIQRDIRHVIEQLLSDGVWHISDQLTLPEVHVFFPQAEDDVIEEADYISTIALDLESVLRLPAIQIAQEIQARLQQPYRQVQIVHPGILFFSVSDEQLQFELEKCLERGDTYGRVNTGRRKKLFIVSVQHDLVSPIELREARGMYIADSLARIAQHLGYRVHQYGVLHDWGADITRFGESVTRRWLQHQGANVTFDDDMDKGTCITAIAQRLQMRDYKLNNLKKIEWVKERITDKALKLLLSDIQDITEHSMHIHIHEWIRDKKAITEGRSLFDELQEHNVRRVIVAGAVPSSWHSLDTLIVDSFSLPIVSITKKGVPYSLSSYMSEGTAIEEVIEEIGDSPARYSLQLFPSDETVIQMEYSLFLQEHAQHPYWYVRDAVKEMRAFTAERLRTKTEVHFPTPELHECARLLTQYPAVLVMSVEKMDTSLIALYILDIVQKWKTVYAQTGTDEIYDDATVVIARAAQSIIHNAGNVLGVDFLSMNR